MSRLPVQSGAAGAELELSTMLREYTEVARRLEATHETLQREVLRLRCELESKDRELERRRRLAALGELAAGVAHEVRNPLGAIQLYSGLLRRECGGLSGAMQLIEKIDAGVQAIDGVVQDTLALTPRSGRQTRVSLNELLRRAVDMCEGILTRRQVSAELRPEHLDACVTVDPDALQRVLINLIANAAEASEPGRTVRMHVSRDEDTVHLHICDEGCGLAPEVLDRILDPFFTTKAHGTGLGLTIAHRLVEAHGGTLRAANRAGGGAEFVVSLPSNGPRSGAPNEAPRCANTSAA